MDHHDWLAENRRRREVAVAEHKANFDIAKLFNPVTGRPYETPKSKRQYGTLADQPYRKGLNSQVFSTEESMTYADMDSYNAEDRMDAGFLDGYDCPFQETDMLGSSDPDTVLLVETKSFSDCLDDADLWLAENEEPITNEEWEAEVDQDRHRRITQGQAAEEYENYLETLFTKGLITKHNQEPFWMVHTLADRAEAGKERLERNWYKYNLSARGKDINRTSGLDLTFAWLAEEDAYEKFWDAEYGCPEWMARLYREREDEEDYLYWHELNDYDIEPLYWGLVPVDYPRHFDFLYGDGGGCPLHLANYDELLEARYWEWDAPPPPPKTTCPNWGPDDEPCRVVGYLPTTLFDIQTWAFIFEHSRVYQFCWCCGTKKSWDCPHCNPRGQDLSWHSHAGEAW